MVKWFLALATAVGCLGSGVNAQCASTPLSIPDSVHDEFGGTVSISGLTVVVGALDIINPVETVRVYEPMGMSWIEAAALFPPPGDAGNFFGTAVAVDGDTLVVGASRDGDLGNAAGAAYVFERVAGVWTLITKLLASDGAPVDRFGRKVAISGDRIVVTALLADQAYVFERDAGGPDAWGEVAILTPAAPIASENYAFAAAIDGETAVVTARSDAIGVGFGRAYVFDRQPDGTWLETAELAASDGFSGHMFGASVDIDGDEVVVGAHLDNDQGSDAGAAYLYRRVGGVGGVWSEVAKMVAPDGDNFDRLGFSVSISGGLVLAGAPNDEEAANGAGSAYLFARDQGGLDAWGLSTKIIDVVPEIGGEFGWAVGIDGTTAIIGEPHEGESVGQALILEGLPAADCNANGQCDADDIDGGNSADCNGNLIPDECDIASGVSEDCNGNGIPDSCDIAAGRSDDCDRDGLPDECSLGSDCNANGVLDHCDIASGVSEDVNTNGWPDECLVDDLACEVAQLLPPDPDPSESMGRAVAMSDGVVVVGAPGLTGPVNRAHVFVETIDGPTNWAFVTTLEASNAQGDADFGAAVALDGETVVVGAPDDDAVYVYERQAGGPDAWGEVAILTGSNTVTGDHFGEAVAIEGDRIVVGAPEEAIGQFDMAGVVYVFERDGNDPHVWTETDRLVRAESFGIEMFGSSVSLSGDTLVAGTPSDHSLMFNAGAVHVFERAGGQWLEQTEILDPEGGVGMAFGRTVIVDGDTLVVRDHTAVSVHLRDQGGPGVWGRIQEFSGGSIALDGDQLVVGLTSGARVHRRNLGGPEAWGVLITAMPNILTPNFGEAVATDGQLVAVGVPSQGLLLTSSAFVLDPVGCGGCPFDLDGDGEVGIVDLLDLLANWGANPGHAADFDGDGLVGITDLLSLLANWGPCAS